MSFLKRGGPPQLHELEKIERRQYIAERGLLNKPLLRRNRLEIWLLVLVNALIVAGLFFVLVIK